MRAQRGISFIGFIIIAMAVVMAAILFMKVLPTYSQYYSVKKAIDNIVRDQAGASPAAVREAFGRQASISSIEAVKPSDLVILTTGGITRVTVDYEHVVPLFSNISLLFHFEYSKSSGGGNSP